jgi:hypothetical protein
VKTAAAIIQSADIDVALVMQQVTVECAGLRADERDAERHESETRRHSAAAQSARESARRHRIQIGKLLARARPLWPARGPAPKGAKLPEGAPASWAEFLRRLDLDDATARRYMDEARDPEEFSRKQRERDPAGEDDDQPEPVYDQERDTPPFRQLTEEDLAAAIARLAPDARKRLLGRANVKGGSGETNRGTWCTAKDWAIAVGEFELDPFSNPRSHILSAARCMLEDGGDAFGGGEPGKTPGLYLTGAGGLQPGRSAVADELTRVWIQPPYELVAAAIAHYGHTRFCALLRWSPDVKAWFPELWKRTAVVCHPFGERMDFEPPPGVPSSGDMPFPHALYYAHEADVTDAVSARCIVWRIDHDTDDVRAIPALHIVR